MTNYRATLLMSGLAARLYSTQSLTATNEEQQIAPRTTFLVIYRPGPAWLAEKTVSEQPLKEHGKYMLSLYVKGWMKLAGPLKDNAGGAVGVGGCRRVSSQSDRRGRSGSKIRELFVRNASVGIKAVG